MTDLDRFIAGLPKAELHLHIEGTLEPEMAFALAERNGMTLPYESVEALRRAYDFGCLQDFLDLYYQGMAVLRTAEDFHDLTAAYLERARADGVVHAEIFFDPQAHTERGVPFGTVVEGINRALVEARERHGMTSHLILCFLRHLDEEAAFKTLDEAMEYRHIIAGVGLDSSERGNPPAKFEQVFNDAREAGFRAVAHAGEEGPADYVREALDKLWVSRIDHGVRAIDDAELVKRLAASRTPLTVCPLSNLKLAVVKDLKEHPLRRLLEAGVAVTVNSDDPAYFGGYVNENYRAVQAALALDRDQLATIARNSLEAAFLNETDRSGYLGRLDRYLAEAA